MSWIKRKWNNISVDPKTIRNFGLILSGLLLGLGGLAFFRGHAHFWVEWPLSIVIGLLALKAPKALSYLYRPWMIVAEEISWVLLRILLGILFYFFLSPMAILLRLVKKDLLAQKIDRGAPTYWNKRQPKLTLERYERLF